MTTVTFPTLEAAVSALCEKVLGAPCVIDPQMTAPEPPPGFRLEAGKCYVTRNGQITTPMEVGVEGFVNHTCMARLADVCCVWTEKGEWDSFRDGNHSLDLVREAFVRPKGTRTEPRFTVAEIADYLAGWQAADDSFAHHNALVQLQCDHEGIAAVVKRRRHSSLTQPRNTATLRP